MAPRDERKALIAEVERIRESRVICCVTSDRLNAPGVIAKDFIRIFYTHLRTFADAKCVDVFIFTTGGDTLAAFGLSRLLRESGRRVGALIPETCHSAGTLLILGAEEIFMTPAATLSPIDPSIQTPLNPRPEGMATGIPALAMQMQPVPVSVESIAGYKELAESEWKLDGPGKVAAFNTLSQKVHPLVLGQAYRSRQQIAQLAETLLRSHRTDGQQIKKIVEHLTRRLGSHDYLISRNEAKELLKKQVISDTPKNELEPAIWKLHESFQKEMELGIIFDPMAIAQQAISRGEQPPVRIKNIIVTIESTTASDVWESELLATPVAAMPQMPAGGLQQSLVFNGWRRYE